MTSCNKYPCIVSFYKIYHLEPYEAYYGHTTNINDSTSYSKQLNNASCNKLLIKYGWNELIVELLEERLCNSKEERDGIRGYYIRNDSRCVNNNKPSVVITEEQFYNNREALNKVLKQTKDKEREEKIKNARCTCVCGSTFWIEGKTKHEKSKKHIDYMENLNKAR